MTMPNHRLRGLNEKRCWAYNPMPAGHSEAAFLKAQDIPVTRVASKADHFKTTWKYGTGLEAEEVVLLPGDPETAPERVVLLREGEARDFEFEKAELGFVVLRGDPYDLRHVLEMSLRGLELAYDHWHQAGGETLIEYQMRGGYSETEMKQLVSRHWKSYSNEGAAEAIRAHMEKLQGQLDALPADAPVRRGKRQVGAKDEAAA